MSRQDPYDSRSSRESASLDDIIAGNVDQPSSGGTLRILFLCVFGVILFAAIGFGGFKAINAISLEKIDMPAGLSIDEGLGYLSQYVGRETTDGIIMSVEWAQRGDTLGFGYWDDKEYTAPKDSYYFTCQYIEQEDSYYILELSEVRMGKVEE
ncbi:hypothetical protein KQI84_12845 [bacterium]|nr:hypothetical protein [bacterium]